MKARTLSCLLASLFVGAATAQEQLPFKEGFDNDQSMRRFVVMDANKDGTTWGYNYSDKCADYRYSAQNDADDWLFSPGLTLKAGGTYALRYKCWTRSIASMERMVPTIGRAQEPGAQTPIDPEADYVMDTEPVETVLEFTVAEGGIYYLGFHCLSPKDKYWVKLDDIELNEKVEGAVPGAVENIVITPAEKGGMQAHIALTAPQLDAEGKSLTELTAIEVMRSGETSPVKVFENPTPGANLEFTDEVMYPNLYTYTFVARSKSGGSESVEEMAYVGPDTPNVVSDVVTEETEEGIVTIRWTAPQGEKGVHGGYVDPTALTYSIVDNNDRTVARDVEGTSFLDEQIPLNETRLQDVLLYRVKVHNGNLTSEEERSGLCVVGTPYTAPLEESFGYATVLYYPWYSSNTAQGVERRWDTFTYGANPQTYAYDDDAGMITFRSGAAEKGYVELFYSPKVDVKSLLYPAVSFYMYHTAVATDNDRLQVMAGVAGQEMVNVGEEIAVGSNEEGWKRHVLRLPDACKGEVVQLALRGIADNNRNIHVDAIAFIDDCTDLAVTLEEPKELLPNTDVKFEGTLYNRGNHGLADAVRLSFTKEGEEIGSQAVNAPEPGDSTRFVFVVREDILACEQEFTYGVAMIATGDEIADNNEASVTMTCQIPDIPTVENLQATLKGEDVVLTWNQPEAITDYAVVTDDFESYEAFIIDNVGPWKFIDMDGAQTGENQDAENAYANAEEPMAYQVYDPEAAGVDMKGWFGQDWKCFDNGKQYLASLYNADESANDDWLISPEVCPMHPISFVARSLTNGYKPEKFEMLYSTKTDATEDFEVLETVETPARWTKYVFDLPKDAKYFAIRHITECAYAFMIDNIEYAPITDQPIIEPVKSYTVYRDNELTAENLLETRMVDAKMKEGTYNYKVTAQYDKGESYYREIEVSVTPSGIEQQLKRARKAVAMEGGIELTASDDNYTVADMTGRVIASGRCTGRETVAANRGVYVVKLGDWTTKVVVR